MVCAKNKVFNLILIIKSLLLNTKNCGFCLLFGFYTLVWFQLNLARTESFVHNNDDKKAKQPHLSNLNEDQLLSGVVFHFLKKGEMTVGRKDAKPPPDICLNGLRFV